MIATIFLVRDNIVTTAHNIPTQIVFKNYAPFIKCITEINRKTIDDAEDHAVYILDLDLVILKQLEVYGLFHR